MQLQGIAMVDRTWQVGMGQRMAEQSAGLVVLVMVGHGVVRETGGRVTMVVLTRVWVGDEVVVGGRGGMGWRRDVVGQASCEVRNSMPQPWYGQSASQGSMRLAVGMAAGQPQGLRNVDVKLQSENWHSLRQFRFCNVRVAVGQLEGVCCAVATDTARPRRTRNFILSGWEEAADE